MSKVYLGSFEAGTDIVVIPLGVLDAANAQLDAARPARERETERAKLATLQAARAQGRLKRALRAVFGRRMMR
jgi:hypothetical protein